jgi:hypothetical protein
MSGYNDDELREQVKLLQPSSFLLKPIGVNDIVGIIEMQQKEVS